MTGKDEAITVDDAVSIIQAFLVNRKDRYGHYRRITSGLKGGTTKPYLNDRARFVATFS